MSFKVIITEEYMKMNGTTLEKLAGLACYITALKSQGIPRYMIDKAIRCGFMNDEELERNDKELDKKNRKFNKENI